jgi:predicted nucleic acid-binding protein
VFFVDTNVLLYSLDSVDEAKQAQANRWIEFLWRTGSGRLSWQVLHEFYVNAVRKMKVDARQAQEVVETFVLWRPVDTSLGLVQRAWYWSNEAGVSYWDGLIAAAAESAGCTRLLTEDFQAGRKFGGITVVSPFAERPE